MLSKNRLRILTLSFSIVCISLTASETIQGTCFDKKPKKVSNKKSATNNNATLNTSIQGPTKNVVNDTVPKIVDSLNVTNSKKSLLLAPNRPINSDTTLYITKKSIGSIYGDGYARIRKKNGDIIVAKIKAKSSLEINFIYPLNTIEEKISLSEIKAINYSDGTLESLIIQDISTENGTVTPTKSANNNDNKLTAKPLETKINNKKDTLDNNSEDLSWEKVEVTDSIEKASGLEEIAQLETKYTGSITVTNASLEKSSEIILRKKAAHAKANLIVITSKTIDRQYGELPSIVLKGTAYSKNN